MDPVLLSEYLLSVSGGDVPLEVELFCQRQLQQRQVDPVDRAALDGWVSNLRRSWSRLLESSGAASGGSSAGTSAANATGSGGSGAGNMGAGAAAARAAAGSSGSAEGGGFAPEEADALMGLLQSGAALLEGFRRRVIARSPPLEGHERQVAFWRSARPFVPQVFHVRHFMPEDENSNPQYQALLDRAREEGLSRGMATFKPAGPRPWLAPVLLATLVVAGGIIAWWWQHHPLRMSLGLLLSFDALLAQAWLTYRMARREDLERETYLEQVISTSVAHAREEIAALERERYKIFIDEELRRKSLFEQELRRLATEHEVREQTRVRQVELLLSGADEIMEQVLRGLVTDSRTLIKEVGFARRGERIELTLVLPPAWLLPHVDLSSMGRLSAEQRSLMTALVKLEGDLVCTVAACLCREILFELPWVADVRTVILRRSAESGKKPALFSIIHLTRKQAMVTAVAEDVAHMPRRLQGGRAPEGTVKAAASGSHDAWPLPSRTI